MTPLFYALGGASVGATLLWWILKKIPPSPVRKRRYRTLAVSFGVVGVVMFVIGAGAFASSALSPFASGLGFVCFVLWAPALAIALVCFVLSLRGNF